MFNKTSFDQCADSFANHLKNEKPAFPYWYAAQKAFQLNWDTSQLDAISMIESAIEVSTDQWSLPLIEAKEVLLKFAEINSDLLLNMFKDLFSENKSLDGRMDRFLFHCDLMLREVNQKKIVLPEHHHNKWIVSVYLTYQFPQQYLPFEYELFSAGMKQMNALKIPEPYEMDRYFKICRIMNKFLNQLPEIKAFYTDHQTLQIEDNMLITYDFLTHLINNKKK